MFGQKLSNFVSFSRKLHNHIALLKMLCVNKLPGQGRRLQSHLCKLSRLKVFENFGGKYRLKLLKFLARSENSKNINKAGKCCV